MLSTSYNNSKTSSSAEQIQLQLMVDDLICGKQLSSIDKKYHPQLVPLLQKTKNEAIANGNQSVELRVNRIMTHLTLTSPQKTPKKKSQLPKQSKTPQNSITQSNSQKDYSEYNEEVDQLMQDKKSFDEIESKNFTPIKICIQQHRDEASKSQDYRVAKQYHSKYLSLSNYIRNLPKQPKHYGDEEYIENLKYKYYDAVQNCQNLEDQLNYEENQLSQTEKDATLLNLSSIQEVNQEFDQEESDIRNCKNYHPSSYLLELRRSEKRCAKIFLYDEADSRLKCSIETENREKENYVQQRLSELNDKKFRASKENQKKSDLIDDKNYYKSELFQMKQEKLLKVAKAEVEAIKEKIEELGGTVPDDIEMILYSTPKPRKTAKKAKTNKSFSNSGSLTQTEDSFADSSTSQQSSRQNKKETSNSNANSNVTSNVNSNVNSNINSDLYSINSDENISQTHKRSATSSNIPRVGTPNSRSIADLTFTRKNKSDEIQNNQNKIVRDKSNEYEFVIEEEEVKEGNINKSGFKETDKNIAIDKNDNMDDESVFLSDSIESEFKSIDKDKKTRPSLSYQRFLTPSQDTTKKYQRKELKYDMYLHSPKTKNDSYVTEDNLTSSQKADNSETEIYYSSITGSPNSKTQTNTYYTQYSDYEEEEYSEYDDTERSENNYSYYNYTTGTGSENNYSYYNYSDLNH